MAVTDNPERSDNYADDIADCIRAGFHVQWVTSQYVRDNWRACTCEPNQPKAGQLPLALAAGQGAE